MLLLFRASYEREQHTPTALKCLIAVTSGP